MSELLNYMHLPVQSSSILTSNDCDMIIFGLLYLAAVDCLMLPCRK